MLILQRALISGIRHCRFSSSVADKDRTLLRDLQSTSLIPKIKSLLYSLPYNNEDAGKRTPVAESLMRRKTYTNKALPSPPTEWTSAKQLEHYIRSITEHHHIDPKVSSYNGLVASTVRDLIRPDHPATRSHLTIGVYNAGIEYFVRTDNIRAARQLYMDLRDFNIVPNTTTFNMFMVRARYALLNPSNQWVVHPLRPIIIQLMHMHELGIPSNAETWNIILTALISPDHKSGLLDEMKRRGIPLSKRSLAICLKDIVKVSNSEFVMAYLHQHGDPLSVGTESISVVLSKLLHEKQYDLAWQFLFYSFQRWNISIHHPIIHTFAKYFAQQGRIDYIFGALGNFYQIKPLLRLDSDTYAYMLESLARAPFHPNIINAYSAIMHRQQKVTSSAKIDYWSRVVRAKLEWYHRTNKPNTKFKLLSPSESKKVWLKSMTCLTWPREAPVVDYSSNSARRAVAEQLGVMSDSAQYIDVPSTKKLKQLSTFGPLCKDLTRPPELW